MIHRCSVDRVHAELAGCERRERPPSSRNGAVACAHAPALRGLPSMGRSWKLEGRRDASQLGHNGRVPERDLSHFRPYEVRIIQPLPTASVPAITT